MPKNPKILFIGRLEPDLGIITYLNALDLLKIEIDFAGDGSLRTKCQKYGRVFGFVDINKIINDYDIIFTSSYLSILEALNHSKYVFSIYENPLKEDYLKMSPLKAFIWIGNNPKDLAKAIFKTMPKSGFSWAKQQTWGNVTDIYLKLWQKHL